MNPLRKTRMKFELGEPGGNMEACGLVVRGFEAPGRCRYQQAAVTVFPELNREPSFVKVEVWLSDPLKL